MAEAGAPPTLHFIYYDLPAWARWWKRGGRGLRLYYSLWQWGAYFAARRTMRTEPFDAVHHITFGTFRHASLMGDLGIPFVLGPLGGAESAPFRLRRHYSVRGKAWDITRDLANIVASWNPFVRRMLSHASVVLLRTPETMRWLPPRMRSRAQCIRDIGSDPPALSLSDSRAHSTGDLALQILFVGRFVYLKGMGLGLRALSVLRDRGVPYTLTMIGQGPEREGWRRLAARLRIDDRINWVPWVDQPALGSKYQAHDVLLFPSLHDSGGTVVLEALTHGLPVVCLRLGGPPEMIDETCGRVIEVADADEAQVATRLADALAEIAHDSQLAKSLRNGALTRAAQLTWGRLVESVWGQQGVGYKAVIEGRFHDATSTLDNSTLSARADKQ
jgi:glycosyltransferase involved in cell wall biosynthesis